MKAALFACAFIFNICQITAQNLVPNGGFENYSACPSSAHQIYLATPWNSPYINGGAAEYFNSCAIGTGIGIPVNAIVSPTLFGFQYARTGNAYGGFNVYNKNGFIRQFIQVKLNDTLALGKVYCLEFYLNLSNYSYYGVDGIAAYFSDSALNFSNSSFLIGLTPQVSNPVGTTITDTLNWTKVSGCFTANGNESYLILGNFLPDSSTTSEQVNTYSGIQWSTYYYIDDVSLVEDTSLSVKKNKLDKSISISPNPASSSIHLSNKSNAVLSRFCLEDLSGRQVKDFELSSTTSSFDISELNSGAYIYKCHFESGELKSGKLIIAH